MLWMDFMKASMTKMQQKKRKISYPPFFRPENLILHFHDALCRDKNYKPILDYYFSNRDEVISIITKFSSKFDEICLRGKKVADTL